MPLTKEQLDKFRLQGDDEAARDLAAIRSTLSEKQYGDLPMILGRWDPSQPDDVLPPAVRDYVRKPFDGMPGWISSTSINAAQKNYTTDHLAGGRFVLGTYSLPILYIDPEIATTLQESEQLLAHVRRRLEDTLAFFESVMSPGSLDAGGLGLKWIRRVRLTHAVARDLVLNGRHRIAFSDVVGPVPNTMPLDQLELALVLQTFSWVMIDGLDKMRWPMPSDQHADHVHVWSAIGWMLGIDELLLPHGTQAVADAQGLFEQLRDEQLQRPIPMTKNPKDPGDTWMSGRLLTAALLTMLVQLQRENIPVKWHPLLKCWPSLDEAVQQLPRILVRRLCGISAARCLRVSRAPLLQLLICEIARMVIDLRKIAATAQTKSSNVEWSSALI